MSKMMTIKVMNEPYYDNELLHPVGSTFTVPEGTFDFGRRGNFGLVLSDGTVKVPQVKTESMKAAEERRNQLEYVWEDGTNPSSDAPIYPLTAGIKQGASVDRSVAASQPTRVQPRPPANVPASMPNAGGDDKKPVSSSSKPVSGSAPTTKS